MKRRFFGGSFMANDLGRWGKKLWFRFKSFYPKNKALVLLLFTTLIPVAFFFLLFPLWKSFPAYSSNLEVVKKYVLSYGSWAAVVFFLTGILAIIAPQVPNTIVVIVGVAIFGVWRGGIYALVIKVLGSTVNYWLGTKIRKGLYLKLTGEKDREKLADYTRKAGWQVVFLSRFLPDTDTDLIGYAAGIAQMDYRPFIVASFLGMVPATIISVVIWNGALQGNKFLIGFVALFYFFGTLFAPKIIKTILRHKFR